MENKPPKIDLKRFQPIPQQPIRKQKREPLPTQYESKADAHHHGCTARKREIKPTTHAGKRAEKIRKSKKKNQKRERITQHKKCK